MGWCSATSPAGLRELRHKNGHRLPVSWYLHWPWERSRAMSVLSDGEENAYCFSLRVKQTVVAHRESLR